MTDYKPGDIIITGPAWLRASLGSDRKHPVSEKRGTHMIVAEVLDVKSDGLLVQPRYLVWDEVTEPSENYGMGDANFLPFDNDSVKMTDLFDRERNNVERMIEWLQYDGQADWVSEHEPEEAK